MYRNRMRSVTLDVNNNDVCYITAPKRHYPPGMLTIMLATSKSVLFPGGNHLLTTMPVLMT